MGTLCGCSMWVKNVGDGPVSANIIWVQYLCVWNVCVKYVDKCG